MVVGPRLTTGQPLFTTWASLTTGQSHGRVRAGTVAQQRRRRVARARQTPICTWFDHRSTLARRVARARQTPTGTFAPAHANARARLSLGADLSPRFFARACARARSFSCACAGARVRARALVRACGCSIRRPRWERRATRRRRSAGRWSKRRPPPRASKSPRFACGQSAHGSPVGSHCDGGGEGLKMG